MAYRKPDTVDINTNAQSINPSPKERWYQKKVGGVTRGVTLFLIAFGLFMFWDYMKEQRNLAMYGTTHKPAIVSKSPKELRIDKIEKQFSAWDGSHRNLERLVKKSMNDPSSYDHIETVYWDRKDHLIVKTTFRGKNAFGGVVKNWVKAKVDLKGNIIQVIEQGS